ncbi:MAG: ABC transporter ATP-binding protein, partial [bacterium]|nr:ABC transporter ATP-binding protein [bacterium]
ITGALFNFLRNFFMYNMGLKIWIDVQIKFFTHLLNLSFNFYDSREVGEIISRFSDAGESIYRIIDIFNRIIMNIISLVIFPVILFMIHPILALIAICLLPLDALLYSYANKLVAKYSRESAEKGAEVAAKNYETLSGIKTVQSLKIEKRLKEKITNLYDELFRARIKTGFLQNGAMFILQVLRGISVFLYMWYGWTQILNGDLSLGKYLAFTMFVGYLYNPLREMITLTQDIQITLVHTNRFFEIYDIPPQIQDSPDAIEFPEKISGNIEFENVSFSYDEENLVLRDISMKIPAGKTAALVGRSGVGKSTIACLIPRFYDPTSGKIKIDNLDTTSVKVASLRSKIGIVMQEPFLFYGTILENITLGRKDFNREKLDNAVKAAHVDEFLQKFPDGIDSMIGERGAKLSQGQKQRIALARILFLEPPILIIDEGTSSLDLESEQYIQQALKDIRKNRTTIIIAHRLSTIKDADIIFVLENGELVEQGDHESLINESKVYKNLYNRLSVI